MVLAAQTFGRRSSAVGQELMFEIVVVAVAPAAAVVVVVAQRLGQETGCKEP